MEDVHLQVAGLYAREALALLRLATQITGSAEDGRDAVQETFRKILDRGGMPDDVVSPEAWLRTILMRTAIDIRRKAHRESEAMRDAELQAHIQRSQANQQSSPPVGEAGKECALGAAFEKLSSRDRAIVLSRSIERLSPTEIGERLGMSEKTVRNRLSMARRLLRGALEAEPKG